MLRHLVTLEAARYLLGVLFADRLVGIAFAEGRMKMTIRTSASSRPGYSRGCAARGTRPTKGTHKRECLWKGPMGAILDIS
jgi:hypothetical protein